MRTCKTPLLLDDLKNNLQEGLLILCLKLGDSYMK